MAEEKTIEERVKDVIVAQLGVDPSEVKPEASFVMTWALILLIRLSL